MVTVLGVDGTVRAAPESQAWMAGEDASGGRASVFSVLHPDDHVGVRATLVSLAARGGTAGPVRFRVAGHGGVWIDTYATLTMLTGEPSLDGAGRGTAGDRPGGPPAVARPAPARVDNPLAEDLGRALDANQFRLVYQPKVALATNRMVGVEALIRWDHPERGVIPPNEFIPLAEATGLIVPIGAWVLLDACRQCAHWQRDFPLPTPLRIAVNASPRQFWEGLIEAVASAITASGVESTSVCLEVTESIVMKDVNAAISILRELKALGLTLSIDDFGTGYSSLEYLRRLPLDEVKIDRSFVAGLATDPEDTAIVAAVISLAHALDRDVVAEGVETVEQLDKLRSFGCELAQGFLLARPMGPADISALLARDAAGPDIFGVGAAPTGTGRVNERVLVVDDAPDVRLLARMTLTAAGFDVQEAFDGTTAIALARRISPSCVVLDIEMPDMTGVEVCRALRAHPATADCTVVIVSSRDSADDKAAAFSAGADDYMVKPFAPRDLVSRVRTAVSRRLSGGSSSPSS